METNTLRIGNKIQDEHGFIFDVVGIGKDWITVDFEGNEGDVWEFDFKHSFPQPIELTEEILLKCEKITKTNGYPYKILNGFIKIRNGVLFFKYYDLEIELPYLHTLQNLYWCLCGEELEIRL